MKLISNNKLKIAICILLSFQIISLVNSFSAKKITELTQKKHKKHKSNVAAPVPATPAAPASGNSTNSTRFSASQYSDLNQTYTVNHLNNYKTTNRKWDFKMLDKQLEQIYKDMLYVTEKRMRPLNVRAFIQTFIGPFETCDKNADNVLSLAEFSACMSSDPYFKLLTVPNVQPFIVSSYVPQQNYTNSAIFYQTIFNILDDYKNSYINFHDYMKLRLMVFSWKHCSVQGPFIEEANFECALEVASGYRTLSKTSVRRLFQLGLELSNSEFQRNLDFISFLYISCSIRLYGKINGKEDGDITRSEFNTALDNNILPIRFSQLIIDQMFALTNQKKIHNQGIDKFTFVFLDFNLRLFTVNNATRPYYVSLSEFSSVLNNTLFPNKTLTEIYAIPSYGMTAQSFQMFASMNVSQFYQEDDYLLKFLEVKNSKKTINKAALEKLSTVFGQAAANSTIPALNTTLLASTIFNLLDIDNDGWVNYQDFAHIMQLLYIFNNNDVYQKGKLTIGKIIDIFKSYSEYPRISIINRERIQRLERIDRDLMINALELIVIFKIDDIVGYYVRESDKTSLYEVDLKNILLKCGLRYIPEAYLTKCLRGNDINNIPKYDWECSINSGIILMSQFYEAASGYISAKKNGIVLTSTAYNNIDPQIK